MKDILVKKAGAKIWRAKLTRPFSTARGQHDILENVLLTVELSSGVKGFGEAAVATHITCETVPETLRNLKSAAREVTGFSVADFPAIADQFKRRFSSNKCALAALEMALLDAASQEMGIPFWRAFGTRIRTLRTDMTVVLGNVPDAEDAAREILRRGIGSFKVKIGRDFVLDLKRVAAVAKLAGKCPLYLDANQGFTAMQTLKFLKELAHLKIRPALIEQPVPKGDWEGLAKVTRDSKVPVCADESVSSLEDARRLIKEKAAGIINIKFMKNGILDAYAIAKLARKNRVKLMIGTMMETPLAVTAAAHLAASLGGFDFIDLDAPFFMAEDVTRGSFVTPSGLYDLSKVKAGIGVVPV
ncbi:MAG TPA: enolase C-terminal domain-like protein [Candidatus Omnitrophota bacterium]|nr:enolase C-terminal domain-like protein [Candidatus Omnitrophota bacterium]HPS37195.1 enolase C-terminal domain-like protein [Candidatus Omnitrophota bacterium]